MNYAQKVYNILTLFIDTSTDRRKKLILKMSYRKLEVFSYYEMKIS